MFDQLPVTKFLNVKSIASCAICGLLLMGCAVGPDYQRPQVDVPVQYKERGDWQAAQPKDESPKGDWWIVFGDDQLNRLMVELNRQNLSIVQAEAQYRQASALLRQAEAGLYPTVTATAARTRAVTSSSAGKVVTQNTLQGGASWELDIWGKVRRSVEAGEANQAASAAQLLAVKLSSQAQLASAYLQLAIADQQLAQLRESEKLLKETLDITQNQYAAGMVSDAAVAQAESQWKTAQASTIDKQLTRAQLEHAVAVAIGKTPASFALPAIQKVPHLPAIPANLPSTLLERRPDIAAAERSVAQANAQIGVAKAAYFPTLSLAASGGYTGSSFQNLIDAPNRIWSIGPQLALTVFDAGLRKSQTDQAIANFDATVASYRQVVLTALQEVEDTLVAQSHLAQESGLQTDALNAAIRSETITSNQYQVGMVGYINLLSAQNSRITAQNTLWTIKNRQYVNSVSLIVALGGDWSATSPPKP